MAVYPFQYSDLRDSINGRIHGKIGLITNTRQLINDVVNEVSGLTLRSAKRKAVLAPNLFNDIYQYAAPSDIDGNHLIDIQPQSMKRDRNNILELVTEAEFDQRKQTSTNLVAFTDHTFVRGLLISEHNADLRTLSIASIQGLTGDSASNASWAAFGNADTLATDLYNFIKGSGSLSFNLTTGGTTSGIVLTTVNVFDLTQYKSNASVFTWAYLTTASNVTNIKLRLGNSASAYYEMTATTPNDGTSFVNGWNLIRFDFNTKTTTGVPTDTTCNYAALFLTKASGTVDTGYRFNSLQAKLGSISNIIYYSQYPWQAFAGTLQNRSTADTDYIVCDQDEYPLFVEKGVEMLGLAARETADSQAAALKYNGSPQKAGMAREYKMRYPTESLQQTSTMYFMGNGGSRYDGSDIWIR